MRRIAPFAAAALVATLAIGQRAEAQGGRGRGGRGGRGGAAAGAIPPGGGRMGPEDQALRRQVRQRFQEVIKRQLNLNDDQLRQLNQTDQKFTRQRQDVTKQERDARQGLRALLEDTTAAPDPAKVDQYLSQLVQAQHKRADILDAEQKELGGFLNPVQRAKYMGLREQLRQRINELQQGRGGARRGGPPPPND